tara:strand:+ start:822 stop:1538 length:717 start_codon:yes stop_codon:yes gene_type:complete
MEKKLSIIIPVYNEKESLSTMIRLLKSSLKFENEVLIVYDSVDDSSVEEAKKLENELDNVRAIHNSNKKGVKYAIDKGVQESIYDIFLITVVDDIFPILAIEEMMNSITNEDYDFISGTRYSLGGKRIGGSLLGSILSRTANKIFQIITKFPFSDSTTGIKMMKKKVWKNISLESKPIGWAFAFELSIKVFLKDYKIKEVPFKSVDRLFGGKSTFKPMSWIREYLKWFIWGIKNAKKK